ncbi:SdpI family protein [Gryllotalpicola reticulitermitis]|uniref:SdpI family protein n=1 Tax=Gryllotalpicola reticulitermitis TaxID=1184153 RepID=A0ABV8QA45_9MICO
MIATVVLPLIVVIMALGVVLGVRACANGRIKLNLAIGLRVGWVLHDEEAWEAGHKAAIPAVARVAPIAVVIALVAAIPAFGELAQILIALVGLAVVVVGLLWGTAAANRAAKVSVESRA